MESRKAAKIRIQMALNSMLYEKGELEEETYRLVNTALLERLTAAERENRI